MKLKLLIVAMLAVAFLSAAAAKDRDDAIGTEVLLALAVDALATHTACEKSGGKIIFGFADLKKYRVPRFRALLDDYLKRVGAASAALPFVCQLPGKDDYRMSAAWYSRGDLCWVMGEERPTCQPLGDFMEK
jgi:hypothetical protein